MLPVVSRLSVPLKKIGVLPLHGSLPILNSRPAAALAAHAVAAAAAAAVARPRPARSNCFASSAASTPPPRPTGLSIAGAGGRHQPSSAPPAPIEHRAQTC